MARILIVDDEESIRFTFESFLSDKGHDVDAAADFHTAVDLISNSAYDLIIADIILGGKTGIDLLGEIKKRKLRAAVVMITGYPNIETASDAVRLGAFDYISKPVKREKLMHTANLALQHKTLQDKAEQYRSNLEAIFRSVKDAIITVDQDLNILEINEAAKKMCSLGQDHLGKPFTTLPPDCRSTCLDTLEKTLASRTGMVVNRSGCREDGKLKQVVTLSTSPLLDSSSNFSGAVMVIKDETRIHDLERNLKERRHHKNIIGQNKSMQKIYDLIDDLSDVQTTVLITGESGTGKELVADAIHYSGARSTNPLVKVNCSALSENLLESELFGHVKGAFTGADKHKGGRFQKADGGTIFLDEIGDISPRVQLRLLRVLQERVFEPVGDSTPVKVDVRVIAATNQNLIEKVKSGEFREDLFYRLRVVEISVPPLRERMDDLPDLIDYFIGKFNEKFKKNIEAVSDGVLKLFMSHHWPGNIRELEHSLEHAFVLCRHSVILPDHLPAQFIKIADEQSISTGNREISPQAIAEAIREAGGNKAKAARLLNISRQTIYRKLMG